MINMIEWASALVPPTPYLGGPVERGREREGERKKERKKDRSIHREIDRYRERDR